MSSKSRFMLEPFNIVMDSELLLNWSSKIIKLTNAEFGVVQKGQEVVPDSLNAHQLGKAKECVCFGVLYGINQHKE